MSLISILAQATTAPTTQPAEMPGLLQAFKSFFPFVVVIVVLYIVMFRGKRQADKKVRNMLESIKKGDKVQTIGGIIGSVLEVRETEVVLKVDETSNTKMRFTRKAIAHVFSDDVKDDKAKA